MSGLILYDYRNRGYCFGVQCRCVYLIQKDFVVEQVLQGHGGIAHSVVAPAAGEWYNLNVKKYGIGMTEEERMAKATEILTDAGYTVPEDEYPKGIVLLPDGREMELFEILTPSADYDPVQSMSGIYPGVVEKIRVPSNSKICSLWRNC